MTREKQLSFCKKCQNQKMDINQGLICNLTGEKATFKGECPDLKIDETIKEFKEFNGFNLRPNEERAKIALSLILIVLVFEIISLISSGMQYNLLQTVSNGGEVQMRQQKPMI